MKKLIIIWIVTFFLTACAPEPTPTAPTISKEIATEIEDIVGIWDSKVLSERGYHYFKPDGTVILAYAIEQLETRPIFGTHTKYWFEGSTFHVDDSCGYGTYEVTVIKENSNPIKLHFEKLDDSCERRALDWKGDMRWVNP